MTIRRRCSRCPALIERGRLCQSCQRSENARRNAKSAAHGLHSPWWPVFRKRWMKSWCQNCGATDRLSFHFRPGGVHSRNPEDYLTLCRSCHGSVDAPRAQRGER